MKLRKIRVKLPGNRVKVVLRRAYPRIAVCRNCGVKLKGIPRLSASKFRNLSKSEKKPNRPYGGNLCSACTRSEIKSRARQD